MTSPPVSLHLIDEATPQSHIAEIATHLLANYFTALKSYKIDYRLLRKNSLRSMGNVAKVPKTKKTYILKVNRIFFENHPTIAMQDCLEYIIYHELNHIACGFCHNHDATFQEGILQKYNKAEQRCYDQTIEQLSLILSNRVYHYEYHCPNCKNIYRSKRPFKNRSCSHCDSSYNPNYMLCPKEKQQILF